MRIQRGFNQELPPRQSLFSSLYLRLAAPDATQESTVRMPQQVMTIRFHSLLSFPLVISLIGLLALSAASPIRALDQGDLANEWVKRLDLPGAESPVPDGRIIQTVRQHIEKIRNAKPEATPARRQWLADYREVLERHPVHGEPKPILTAEGQISRYVVGFVLGDGTVGGFLFVSPDGTEICGEMHWTPELNPLWTVDLNTWNQAGSINEIPELEELVTPSSAFTMGIPVEPVDHPSWTFVRGAQDEMPYKTQEERKAWLTQLNEKYKPERPLEAFTGRRTGTSKCMSVAASYVADWWCTQVGRELPTYTNGVGGQKEYGHNPRRLESIFYLRNKDEGSPFNWDFQTAPFGKDRVTGERVPFSMRSYARILTETDASSFSDSLFPSVRYEYFDNPFAMDDGPVFLYKRASYDEEKLKEALNTWGPLLAQHTSRSKEGRPKRFVGIHGVVLVGYGELNGRTVFVYRESFGENSSRYLEDSFGGPRLRAFSLPFLYQAIAFPHRLELDLNSETDDNGHSSISIAVATNRGQDKVDPDTWMVQLDGEMVDVTPVKIATGTYRLELDVPEGTPTAQVTIFAGREYFADKEGNGVFSNTVPISRGYSHASDESGQAIEAPSAQDAIAAWAEEVVGEIQNHIESGDLEKARATIQDLKTRVPGVRRVLMAKLYEIYGGDGSLLPPGLGLAAIPMKIRR